MVPASPSTGRIGPKELIALLSMAMALGALGVDLMLPAFSDMRAEFGLDADSNEVAGAVTAYVLGLAGGMLLFGPLSDRFGRRPGLFVGFGVYALGAVGSALAPTLEILFLSRLVWGFGAAGPRTISLSIIRDLFDGDRMARVMSFTFAVFIVVPIVAPSLGAGIIAIAPWQWVFWAAAVFVAGIALWTTRLEETLRPDRRLSLSRADIVRAARIVFGNRQTLGHMLALTASFGAFVSWLASSELIVDDILDMKDRFPLIFAAMAAAMGVAMLANGALVERLGVVRMLRVTTTLYIAASVGLLTLSLASDGTPGLWPLLTMTAAVLSMHALLIPNTNSRAMDPMGALAGTAAAIIGAVSTGIGALLGAVIDRLYDGTVTPLALGFVASSLAAALLVRWADRKPAPVSVG